MLFDFLVGLVGVLLGVAFFTLMERKVLGYVHFRKGPTKIFFFGLFQPIRDAVKLFSKEVLKGYRFSFYYFLAGPILGLYLMFILWGAYGSFFGVYGRFFSLVYIVCFLRLGVYFLLFCGWGAGRKYSLLGGIVLFLKLFLMRCQWCFFFWFLFIFCFPMICVLIRFFKRVIGFCFLGFFSVWVDFLFVWQKAIVLLLIFRRGSLSLFLVLTLSMEEEFSLWFSFVSMVWLFFFVLLLSFFFWGGEVFFSSSFFFVFFMFGFVVVILVIATIFWWEGLGKMFCHFLCSFFFFFWCGFI